MSFQSDPSRPIGGILDRLVAQSHDGEVTLAEMVGAFGEASFAPALMVPALLVVSPLSGIPLFSSVCGLTIALIAAQILAGRRHLWLPGWILRRGVDGRRMRGAITRLRGVAEWIDRRTRPRWRAFRYPPLSLLAPLAAVAAGLAMPFLELVPFSSSILGTAVLAFSLSLLARDGLFVVIGLGTMAAALALPYLVVSSVVA